MRIAVVDLGTNTFNLLICDVTHSSFTVVCQTKRAPKIGLEGINTGILPPQAINRGVLALTDLYAHIQKYSCERIIAIGTSALRNAQNKQDFIDAVYQKFNIEITVISGKQEAEYVFLGNKMAYDWGGKTALILDIGGGSNECIICDSEKILWKESFENGMQRIENYFSVSYPLSSNTQTAIHSFLEETFAELDAQVNRFSVDVLVGSSGPFDTFRDIMLGEQLGNSYPQSYYEFDLQSLNNIHSQLFLSNKEQIAAIPGMDPARIESQPIASCIVRYLISKYNIPQVVQSKFSLKEGVISTFIS